MLIYSLSHETEYLTRQHSNSISALVWTARRALVCGLQALEARGALLLHLLLAYTESKRFPTMTIRNEWLRSQCCQVQETFISSSYIPSTNSGAQGLP